MDQDSATYTMRLNAAQARVVKEAMELYSRIGLGQLEYLLEMPTLRGNDMLSSFDAYNKALAEIAALKKTLTGLGPHTFRSVESSQVSEEVRVAWDIFVVIRHQQALHRANSLGGQTDEAMALCEQGSVAFDKPRHLSCQPLPGVTVEVPSPDADAENGSYSLQPR
jgi:hypothetical protein